MSTVLVSTGVTIEEYLYTPHEPECEYLDEKLVQKPMGTNDHARLQARLTHLLYRYAEAGLCEVVTEQSLRVREGAILIPDVCLLRPGHGEHGIVSTPALLCIEVLSPSDLFSYTARKCREYLQWGVLACWIFDPVEKEAWLCDAGGLRPVEPGGTLRTGAFELSLAELWP